MVKPRFVTAILAERPPEKIVDFPAANGFACLEVMCWPEGTAERRHAGVMHIDVDSLDDNRTRSIQETVAERGCVRVS